NAALIEEESGDPTQVLWPSHRILPKDLQGFMCGLADGEVAGEEGLMPREAFELYFECPVDPSEYLGGLGGPHSGGHGPPAIDWYIVYGMDLQSNPGAKVYAAFDGTVSVYHPHGKYPDTPKIYGAQIFIRNPYPVGKMGGFYTHITNVPGTISVGTPVSRGDFL